MPAFYAHQQFANEVLTLLPDSVRQAVHTHGEAFVLGSQGPDILFNYKPFSKTETRKKGSDLHHAKSKAFFQRAHALCQEHDDAMRSYVAGFICHFILDNACHPDIYRLEAQGFWHGRIESEFDKYLKIHFRDAVHYNATKILSAKNGAASSSALLLEVQEREIKKAIKTMRFVNGCFSLKSRTWQRFAGWVLKKANAETFFSMFLHLDNLPETDALNPVLAERFMQAKGYAAKLITEFFTETPSDELFDAFDKDYKGEPIYEQ